VIFLARVRLRHQDWLPRVRVRVRQESGARLSYAPMQIHLAAAALIEGVFTRHLAKPQGKTIAAYHVSFMEALAFYMRGVSISIQVQVYAAFGKNTFIEEECRQSKTVVIQIH